MCPKGLYLDHAGLDELSRRGDEAEKRLRRAAERANLAAQMRKTWYLLLAYYFPGIVRFFSLK